MSLRLVLGSAHGGYGVVEDGLAAADLVGGYAHGGRQLVALHFQHLRKWHPRPRHQDDESDLRVLGRHLGRHEPALRMADQANLRRIDVVAGAQVSHVGGRIDGEVIVGGRSEVAGGLAEAAVVHAQHRDAVSGEPVGDHCEWLVPEDGLVAVLGAGAGDHHHGRERALARGQGERAGERHARRARDRHLFGPVGEGRLGGLWPVRSCRLHRPRGEAQGPLVGHAGPGPVDRAAIARQRPFEARAVDLEAHLSTVTLERADRHAVGELVGGIQAHRSSVRARAQMQDQADLCAGGHRNRRGPISVEARDHRQRLRLSSGQHQRQCGALPPFPDPGLAARVPATRITGVDRPYRKAQGATLDLHVLDRNRAGSLVRTGQCAFVAAARLGLDRHLDT